MDSLADAVRSEFTRSFRGGSDWEVVSTGSNHSSARSPGLLIDFALDPRDQSVSSAIIFPDAPGKHKGPFYSYIIADLFPAIDWKAQAASEPLPRRVALEVENVRNILHAIEEESVRPRDLFYFQRGHAAGYTAYVNS